MAAENKYGAGMWVAAALIVIVLSAPWWWPWRETVGLVLAVAALLAATGYGLWAAFGRYCILAAAVGLSLSAHPNHARDIDGRFAASPLKSWFDNLKSKGGALCCSDSDGTALSDVDWETRAGRYRVRLDGEWIDVPDEAVITEPNRAGRTMVWPLRGYGGLVIRCFMPGSMI